VRAGAASVNALLGDVELALRRHIGEAAQYDDITLLAFRRNPDQREFPTGRMVVTEPAPGFNAGGKKNRR
jgi:hypothetical protein